MARKVEGRQSRVIAWSSTRRSETTHRSTCQCHRGAQCNHLVSFLEASCLRGSYKTPPGHEAPQRRLHGSPWRPGALCVSRLLAFRFMGCGTQFVLICALNKQVSYLWLVGLLQSNTCLHSAGFSKQVETSVAFKLVRSRLLCCSLF